MAATVKERKFMEIAVEDMLKSRAEHANKIDPLVGAVLVGKKGVELDRAHRGALREGDHAEYTLIERIHGDKDLEGASLYVTLEPCTSRNPPKKPCAERIAKARIRKVFVGMTDPNPVISGRGIQYLLDHHIEVQFFDLDFIEEIRAANRHFITYCESAENELENEEFEGPSETETEPVLTASLDDLSLKVIQNYLIRRGRALDLGSEDLWIHMMKNGFVEKVNSREFRPTTAGLLLFGEKPADFLVHSCIFVEEHVGHRVTTGEIVGPLLGIRDLLVKFLRKGMRTFTEIQQFDRIEIEEYPIEVLREAVVNALAHRDYRAGWHTTIQKYRDRIVIRSPGQPLRPNTLQRLRSFTAAPYSRNPRIASTLRQMGWMEERARGLRQMRNLMLERGLRPPTFDVEGAYLIVTFYGQEGAWQGVRVAPELLGVLDELERETMILIMRQGRVSTAQCAANLGVSVATARRY